jgi:hypothetical protein
MQAMDDRAGQYQGTDEDLASMLGEDVAPMQQAQPGAPQDKRISRYEEQLARLEAEEKDKLGVLIEFLLAAGASGGTNLGATLTGGGSGLMARDARIRDEMTQTLKNIETLQLEREKMAQQGEQFTQTLTQRADLATMDITSAENIAKWRNEADKLVRQATNKNTLTQEENANLRAIYNNAANQLKVLSEARFAVGLDPTQRIALANELEAANTTLRGLEAAMRGVGGATNAPTEEASGEWGIEP